MVENPVTKFAHKKNSLKLPSLTPPLGDQIANLGFD